MVEICEVIEEYGRRSGTTDKVMITFGDLFKIYQVISDKVGGPKYVACNWVLLLGGWYSTACKKA